MEIQRAVMLRDTACVSTHNTTCTLCMHTQYHYTCKQFFLTQFLIQDTDLQWACLKHEMAKRQYISVFQKGKRNVCLKCPKFAKTESQKNPTRKHSTHLHRKLEIIGSFHTVNSCRVPLKLILTLNCL